MKSTTKALVAAGVAVAVALGLIVWQAKGGAARTVNVTAEEMTLIAESLPPQARAMLARSEEERKEFAKNIREMFAVAEEGRKAGVADKPEVRRQLQLMRMFVVAQQYELKQREAGKTQEQSATKEEIDAFLKESGQDQRFNVFLEDVQKLGLIPGGQEVPEEQKQQLREEWARVSLIHRKAVAAGLDKDPKVQMQMRLQEARMIASLYAKEHLGDRLKATDKEIEDYIASHPELDPKKAREKAEEVLKRARGGEDFGALAKEFSTDPSNKDKGGDLGWFGRGRMVEAFDQAAFALQKPGDLSEVIETPFGFHVIKLQERGMKPGADGKQEEQVHASHILISSGGTNQFGMPQSPQDQARAAVEQEKREKLINEIVARNKVEVAENFTVKAPEMPRQQSPLMTPPGAEPGGEAPAPNQAAPPTGGSKQPRKP